MNSLYIPSKNGFNSLENFAVKDNSQLLIPSPKVMYVYRADMEFIYKITFKQQINFLVRS